MVLMYGMCACRLVIGCRERLRRRGWGKCGDGELQIRSGMRWLVMEGMGGAREVVYM